MPFRAHYGCRLGSLLPEKGSDPKFGQIYVLDNEAAVDQRLAVMPNVRRETLVLLTRMMDEVNPFAGQFKAGRHLLQSGDDVKTIGLRGMESTELSKRYAAPTSNEVMSVVPGDGELPIGPRELIIQATDGRALLYSFFLCIFK